MVNRPGPTISRRRISFTCAGHNDTGIAADLKVRRCPGVVVDDRPALGAGDDAAARSRRADSLTDQADSEAIRLAMADLRLAAWFLWMTPLLAALSS